MKPPIFYTINLKSVFCLLGLFIIAGLPGHISAASFTSIKIIERTEVEKDKIVLGKIAKIKGEDQGLIQRLRSIVIGKSPLPGKSRWIDEDYVRMRLKQYKIDLNQIRVLGSKKVLVFRGFIRISKEKIKEIVLDFLHKNMPWKRSTVKIKKVQVRHDTILPKGEITYRVIPPDKADFLGTMPLSILFNVNGHLEKKVWATVNIEVLTEVVVTRRPVKRHNMITEEDIYLKKKDLADVPSNVINDLKEVLGKRAKRAINAKKVLRTDLIELPPLVRRGDVVLIVAESDGLKITALGEVKETGCLGERIRVVNLDSKKEIYARVLGMDTVKVDF